MTRVYLQFYIYSNSIFFNHNFIQLKPLSVAKFTVIIYMPVAELKLRGSTTNHFKSFITDNDRQYSRLQLININIR